MIHKGEPGDCGPAGPAGKDGDDGFGQLAAGAGYTTTWQAGEFGETIESCPEGEYVTGGGYSTWGGFSSHPGYDLGGENTDIQVTVSAPYFPGAYEPISETDSRFLPTQWVVRGFNNGDTDQIVRAWVICAPAAE